MSTASANNFRFTRATQRRNAFVLAVALCVWLFAAATHLHAADDHLDATKTACSFCLSLPGGAAPPPAAYKVCAPVLQALGAACDQLHAVSTRDVPSFYSSRAPPAR